MTEWRGTARTKMTAVAAIVLALALAGCGSTSSVLSSIKIPGLSSDEPPKLVGTPPAQAGATPVAGIDPSSNCPTVDVRTGASTYSINASGADQNALNLRYQASISQLARECAVLGATMTIKVGVQGRVVLGPAGGPGEITVPLRYAVVKEGVEPKTIVTKTYQVPIGVPPGDGNIAFTHIEQDLTFPTPTASEIESYIVYVGFDPEILTAKRTAKPRQAKKRTPQRSQ
jgi:hypothetical protein